MRKFQFLMVVFAFVGSLPAIAFSEEVFVPVKKVYMADGKVIECQMGWLDGDKMICRKFGGSMTLPLRSVNFEKTFPKYKSIDGETVLLVHPGPRYQDENIVISDVRMVRGPDGEAKSSCKVVFEIMNRGDPCEVRVMLNALDAQGRILHQIDVASKSRLDTGESALLKKRLEGLGAALESQTLTLKVSQVERINIEETLLNGKRAGQRTAGEAQDMARQEKIRALKEVFLRERPFSP